MEGGENKGRGEAEGRGETYKHKRVVDAADKLEGVESRVLDEEVRGGVRVVGAVVDDLLRGQVSTSPRKRRREKGEPCPSIRRE